MCEQASWKNRWERVPSQIVKIPDATEACASIKVRLCWRFVKSPRQGQHLTLFILAAGCKCPEGSVLVCIPLEADPETRPPV